MYLVLVLSNPCIKCLPKQNAPSPKDHGWRILTPRNSENSNKSTKISKKNGLSHLDLDRAYAGDIVSIAGVSKSKVTMTATE